MTKPEDAKAAPADPRSGLNANERLGNAVMPRSYRGVATAASAPAATAYDVVLDHLVRSTLDRHGLQAFDMPKRAAAVHEAGHAVLFVAEGEPVHAIRIEASRRHGSIYWSGLTTTTAVDTGWRVDASTPVAVILQRIRFTLAGVVAESIHEGDEFRGGSSLDERARAIILARHAVVNGRYEGMKPDELLHYQMGRTAETLERHRVALLALAGGLEAEEQLRGRRLAALLAPIGEAGR